MKLSDASVAITLKQVQKTFAGGMQAVKPLDLHVQAGETLVLLGPSGCGKTTTLRLIAGLEFADEGGQIFFGDQDVSALPIEKRQVGMVFQSYALFPNMNVTENIEYGLRVRGEALAARREKVAEMLAMFDLEQYALRRVDQLSGGQRQRVALARAIITTPRVLLLDEPLSALDAQLKKRLRTEIRDLLKRLGITAIYVTHDQEEAMEVGDRIAVLDQGEIAQIGSAEAIYLSPQTPFVAGFIGQMNYFSGTCCGNRLSITETQVLTLTAGDRRQRETQQQVTQQKVTVMIRPEDIRLEMSDEKEGTDKRLVQDRSGDNRLSGRVLSSAFLGDRTRVWVDIAGDHEPVCVDCFARQRYAVQQPVSVVIDPQRMVWLKEEQRC